MSALKLLEIRKVISLQVLSIGNESIRDKDRSRVMSKRNFLNVIFATVQYRPKFLYEMVYLYGRIRESARNLKAENFD